VTELLCDRGSGNAVAKNRLYGWLMPEYRKNDGSLLREHLPHRTAAELAGIAGRLGWASWEDCNLVLPGSCSWLTVAGGRRLS